MTIHLRKLLPMALIAIFTFPSPVAAIPESLPDPDPVQRTWMRADLPVARNVVERTWMWGPVDDGVQTVEPYAESPDAARTVTYFDKSRMEITHPGGDSSSEWHVTNGLLVVELMTGRLQTGDDAFEDRTPAVANVAGDPDDLSGPTYATLAALRGLPASSDGSFNTTRVTRDGVLVHDPSLAAYGAIAVERVTVLGIDHQVASPFWEFMNSSGVVFEHWRHVEGSLFPNPYYATGFPVTEAYWAEVKVANVYRDVLVQCFERRCLTYTPDNPHGWQIEAGNVGRHYYSWRYGTELPEPSRLEVTFNIHHGGSMIASTITSETFFGELAVGEWQTRSPSGELLAHGMLWAEHSLTGIEAVIVQDWPNTGWGNLVVQYQLSFSGLSGVGTLGYSVETASGMESGTTSMTAQAASLTLFDVTVAEIPPVLFTGS
ncbi:MAG TPA: hypothetical protein VMM78_17805 [Thermomicrobiales bacterium]|nr:hypothetical protein [Thermomicrobiales bacterium]